MKFLDLSFDRLSALGYAPGYRVQQVQKARHSVETTRSKKAHTPACRARVEGEEMIQSEPKSESDLTVYVRRHPSGGPTAVYRFSDIDGFHRDRVSDGVGRETSHDALFGYVMCDGAVSGAVAHSCRHGPAPHRIKVCIPKTCNKEDWKAIEAALKAKGK